jgi:type II secretory pathway pseudopilin PulG
MIMVTVVAFIIIMTIVLIGILSRSISQAVTAEEQVKRIYAEQVQKSALWKAKAWLDAQSPLVANCTAFNANPDFTTKADLSVAPNVTMSGTAASSGTSYKMQFKVEYTCSYAAGVGFTLKVQVTPQP